MAEHVQDDPATFIRPIIPGRTLRGLPISLKDPISEFSSYGENSPEESAFDQMLQFAKTRQKQLVLHDSAFDSPFIGQPSNLQSGRQVFGNRFLAIDVLSRRDS